MDDLEDTMDMQDYQENLNNDQENNKNIPLVDTTNTVDTRHQILQQFAYLNLEDYTKKIVNCMSKEKKQAALYEIRDFVRIAISKIVALV
ncbi:retrotransposon nucleocapsid protein [Gigaspora margarita]|uniref:Retrotransposon nucleocapsid protein n=1 Tax=Gigaspora margarita TaxID=4874 RepID=A0A8H4AXG1_GIGMA|nr:retrotransposon nucleocapsid protein [Gigaspora margarita]